MIQVTLWCDVTQGFINTNCGVLRLCDPYPRYSDWILLTPEEIKIYFVKLAG
jgi:hypothetical protein